MKRILFITPTFARTGSEMVLWNLITNLNPKEYKIFLFSMKNGELIKVLPDHIESAIPYKASKRLGDKITRKILKIFGVKDLVGYQAKQIQKKFKADLWFINTLIVPEVHKAAKEMNVRTATYHHEADIVLSGMPGSQLERIVNLTDFFIGCASTVTAKIALLGHKNIKLQNSFIDDNLIHVTPNSAESIKSELGISSNDYVWVISGKANYMKGLDLAIPVVQHFLNQPIKILWVGDHENSALYYYIRNAAEKISPGTLIFTGAQSAKYYDYMSIADGFLMLSRDECFPLVMLEAAYLQKPIVAYDCGIVNVFVEDGMGKVIQPVDSKQLCSAMEWVQQNPDRIDKEKLKAKAMEFTVGNQVPKFEKLLEEILNT